MAAIDGFPAEACTGCAAEFDGLTSAQITAFVADDADFGQFVRRYFTAARRASGTTATERASSALTEYVVICEQEGELPCDCDTCSIAGFTADCTRAALQDYEKYFQMQPV
ncbi:hypothetical protein [Amycolatopsis sp. lyj-108]|uniref:hypothetical protein n=1 Tax=Amycolatopsis sp. lyj-108 TaxID=2789286 RepID=UPI00397CEBB2